MASKRLKLNEDKTLIISLATRQQLDKITAQNAESAESLAHSLTGPLDRRRVVEPSRLDDHWPCPKRHPR